MSDSSQKRPIKRPVTRRGQHTRQKILDSAEEVFGETGFDRASIAEITRRAGVGQGTFYIYFPDKTAILVELVRELSQCLRQDIAESIAGLTDRIDIEREGFRTFFSFTHKHRNLYKIVRQAEFVDENIYRWYYQHMAQGYTEGLRQAIEQGQIRDLDPECLAYCLMGIGDFLGMRWVLWTEKGMPKNIFDTMMAFIRHGLALSPDPEKDP